MFTKRKEIPLRERPGSDSQDCFREAKGGTGRHGWGLAGLAWSAEHKVSGAPHPAVKDALTSFCPEIADIFHPIAPLPIQTGDMRLERV